MVSRKNLTVLFLVCALAQTQSAHAQVEMVVIQLGFTALRLGAELVGQMKNRTGINYDPKSRKNKSVDPIHEAWGYCEPAIESDHAEANWNKISKQSLKEEEHSAEATAKASEANAVKSVHAAIVARPPKEETAKEEKSEKDAGSNNAEPKEKDPPGAPYVMMKVTE